MRGKRQGCVLYLIGLVMLLPFNELSHCHLVLLPGIGAVSVDSM